MAIHLQVRRLGCERDYRWLFSDLEFSLAAGELCRVEGPNGSGKTTLLKILSGQLGDYRGELRWCGERLDRRALALRGELLYLGHRAGLKGALSALENLAWYQALGEYRCDEAEAARWQALAQVGLSGFEELPVERLSAGQQRRVALARLHLERRALWILDEPFTAIDAESVARLEGWMMAHRDAGGAVVVTTHHPLRLEGAVTRVCLDGRGGQRVIAA